MSEYRQPVGSEAGNILCRVQKPATYPDRFPVPDACVAWDSPCPEYAPIVYDAPRAESPQAKAGDYADHIDPRQVDWSKRLTFSGPLHFNKTGYPLNPGGRTGIEGRGILNAWGPTVAVDAIITRDGPTDETELLIITRADNHHYGLPAGKFNVNARNEPWETPSQVASRETREETGADLDFTKAREVFRGYVDDERNTDNAWMESIALHCHLEQEEAAHLVLAAQETDAEHPEWRVITPELLDSLNASNGLMVRAVLGI